MEVTLIKINENTFKTTYDKENDDCEIYNDKEIIYDGDDTCIVCIDCTEEKIYYYERLLLRKMIKETSKELKSAYEEVSNLNKRYIGLVNKLIGE